MARIEQRGTGYRVTVRLPGGKRPTATFDTQAEADTWAAEQERLKALGTVSAAGATRVTNGELWEVYDAAVGSKTDSARWNAFRVSNWQRDPLAKMRVTTTLTHDINEWIERRLTEVSPATVNRELNLMSGTFSYAVNDRRWITVNPCYGCRRPERGRPRKRPLLTLDEIAALSRATGYDEDPCLITIGGRVGACFKLALETGMRSGEILRLRPRDYKRDEMTVHVAAVERGGRKSSKSGRSAVDPSRNVPLTATAIEILDRLLRSMPKGQEPQPGFTKPPYIVGINDQQRDANWRKARDMSGVEDLTFHDTKHEAATRLAGFLDVLALSHAIGTKDVRLLRDTYYNSDASRSAALLPQRLGL